MKGFTLFFLLLASSLVGIAQDRLEEIQVEAPLNDSTKITVPKRYFDIGGDSSSLLDMTPGVSLQKSGGVSSLPIIQGMADDRVNVKIDGATSTSACPNHMNPALSYIAPSDVSSIEVFAGITPVSAGGDSIGGSVVVRSKNLVFADQSEKLKQVLNFKSYYKSNNENQGASFHYAIATTKYHLGYSGFNESAHNYRMGGGDRLKSTLFNQNSQTLDLGNKLDNGILALKYTRAIVPYQGFINQRMDMTKNESDKINLSYKGSFLGAAVESTVFYQKTDHEMDYLTSQREGQMPMITDSNELGYNFKASFEITPLQILSIGSEFDRYRINDYWPGLPGVTNIMGPDKFQSLNHASRDRLGIFTEVDSEWSKRLSTNLGVRADIITMNTGSVHGYNDTDNLPQDAAYFNSKRKFKRDHNIDATLTSKYVVNSVSDIELGFGRKNRSPNLYERYAWAGSVTDPTNSADLESMSASMDMLMINWFGDGNGYVGNLALKPETSHKLSLSYILHDEASKRWELKISPYYSEVKNFIDADYLGTMDGNNYLKFANHDAVVFGSDISGKLKMNDNFAIKTVGSYTRGYRKDGKADLYHIMPLNGKLSLEYSVNKLTSQLGTTLVAQKTQVNEMRREFKTAGYALFDVGFSYQWSKLLRTDLAVNNILDHKYSMPMGGVDLVHSLQNRRAVFGMGRSVNLALNLDFF